MPLLQSNEGRPLLLNQTFTVLLQGLASVPLFSRATLAVYDQTKALTTGTTAHALLHLGYYPP